MPAAIKFYSVNPELELVGSGVGFFAATWGASVQIGNYQDTSFIHDGTVSSPQGPQITNTKYTAASTVSVNGDTAIPLSGLFNASGTLKVQFTFDSPVKVQSAEARIFDRVNKDNDPSGVTAQVAEIINTGFAGPGSGDTSWIQAAGSGTVVPLADSPGLSGLSPSGSNTTDLTHEWFLALASSPDSIGSKTLFGLFVQLEYL